MVVKRAHRRQLDDGEPRIELSETSAYRVERIAFDARAAAGDTHMDVHVRAVVPAGLHVEMARNAPVEQLIAQRGRDAHDLHRQRSLALAGRIVAALGETNLLTDRILVRKQTARERVVDDGDAWRRRRVFLRARELAASPHLQAKRAK